MQWWVLAGPSRHPANGDRVLYCVRTVCAAFRPPSFIKAQAAAAGTRLGAQPQFSITNRPGRSEVSKPGRSEVAKCGRRPLGRARAPRGCNGPCARRRLGARGEGPGRRSQGACQALTWCLAGVARGPDRGPGRAGASCFVTGVIGFLLEACVQSTQAGGRGSARAGANSKTAPLPPPSQCGSVGACVLGATQRATTPAGAWEPAQAAYKGAWGLGTLSVQGGSAAHARGWDRGATKLCHERARPVVTMLWHR